MVLSSGTLTAIVATYIRIRGPHYLSYFESSLRDNVFKNEGELSPYIFSTYEQDPFIIRHERQEFRVQTNKEAISDALSLIASQEKEGISKARKFIRLNPLEISLQDHLPEMLNDEGNYYEPVGIFDGSLTGGPTVSFSKDFITMYASRLISKNLTDQADIDGLVYHELIHFWQDLRNPYKRAFVATQCRSSDSKEGIDFVESFCPEDVGLEKEAKQKSSQLIQKLRAAYISGKIVKSPFGSFFSFQSV